MIENTAVCVKDIYFTYFNSQPILKGIDISIKRATIYGLLGPSGCGKT